MRPVRITYRSWCALRLALDTGVLENMVGENEEDLILSIERSCSLRPRFSDPCMRLAVSCDEGDISNGCYSVSHVFVLNPVPCFHHCDDVFTSTVEDVAIIAGFMSGATVLLSLNLSQMSLSIRSEVGFHNPFVFLGISMTESHFLFDAEYSADASLWCMCIAFRGYSWRCGLHRWRWR